MSARASGVVVVGGSDFPSEELIPSVALTLYSGASASHTLSLSLVAVSLPILRASIPVGWNATGETKLVIVRVYRCFACAACGCRVCGGGSLLVALARARALAHEIHVLGVAGAVVANQTDLRRSEMSKY